MSVNTIFKNILKYLLKITAVLTLKKYKPIVVGITGSAGKTSAKEAIYAVLNKKFSCRRSRGNLNNEFGMPLTILGDHKKSGRGLFWLRVLALSWLKLIFIPKKFFRYPKVLVLEMAADKPGDISYLTKIARPQIGVITAIGDIPVHVEYYNSPEAVAKEKSKLIESLPADGFAVLNGDDEVVFDLAKKTRASVLTCGFSENCDIRLGNFEYRLNEKNFPLGISLKAQYSGSFAPMRINGALGKPQAHAVGAAIGAGIAMNMNLIEISEALIDYQSPEGRLKLITGIKNTLILDDSYNASPISMRAALETLENLPAKRKVAVLADMLEIGKYSVEAHENIGRLAGKVVDILFCVGPQSKFIAEQAVKSGLKKENIFEFNTSEEAKKEIEKNISSGDLILIKGSHAMELDKVIEEIKMIR